MAQRDNILQELKELQSSLPNDLIQDTYLVPSGYFDNLAEQVLNRVRAMETENAREELDYLSPLLSTISKKMPFTVPVGFFNEVDEKISATITKDSADFSPAKELENLSPLLSGLKKEMPFTVPQGYFENINPAIQPKTKVISITGRKWLRYAAAAVVTGLIVVSGFLIFNRPATMDPQQKSVAKIEKDLKKVSTNDIDKFVQLTDVEAPVVASIDTKEINEVKELMKDVSDKDIQKFLEETPADEADNSDSGELMN